MDLMNKSVLCWIQGPTEDFCERVGQMAVIEEFATNSRWWSKEKHQSRRVATVEADEESSFAKELSELKVRVN